MVSKNPRH